MKVATSSKARGPRGFYFLGFFGLRKEAKDSLDLSDSKLSEGLKKIFFMVSPAKTKMLDVRNFF